VTRRPFASYFGSLVFGSTRRTPRAPHVRSTLDWPRFTAIVRLALLPCVVVGLWNTGFQAHLALEAQGTARVPGWRGSVLATLGLEPDPGSVLSCMAYGATFLAPALLVALATALAWKALFAAVRRRPMVEGSSVAALLFVLSLPPAVPLWQIAVGMSFGIVVAEEMFGGTGRNFVHPALAARAFLYFAYPAQHSGASAWIAVDGATSATPLTAVALSEPGSGMAAAGASWSDAFLGALPGCMGETSTLACLVGAAVLVGARVASGRVILGVVAGATATAWMFNAIGSDTNAMYAMPPHWHLVTGGLAFGTAFFAADPVTSAQTDAGRLAYGLLVGFFCIVVRVLNPGYAESVMIVLLLGNVFAPLIDWFVIQANARRRRLRDARG